MFCNLKRNLKRQKVKKRKACSLYKISGSENLWLHRPSLMNAQRYANPVHSILALSHVIASDLYDV